MPMSHSHCTTKGRGFKHLTERQRYQIEILIKEKKDPKEIAKLLGKHKRTIEREIARGAVRMLTSELEYKNVYCADTAQLRYRQNGQNKVAGLKAGKDHKLAQHIEKKIIQEKYSPDAVIEKSGPRA